MTKICQPTSWSQGCIAGVRVKDCRHEIPTLRFIGGTTYMEMPRKRPECTETQREWVEKTSCWASSRECFSWDIFSRFAIGNKGLMKIHVIATNSRLYSICVPFGRLKNALKSKAKYRLLWLGAHQGSDVAMNLVNAEFNTSDSEQSRLNNRH